MEYKCDDDEIVSGWESPAAGYDCCAGSSGYGDVEIAWSKYASYSDFGDLLHGNEEEECD